MGVDDQNVKMFQSALYPALVTFMTQPSEEDKEVRVCIGHARDLTAEWTLPPHTPHTTHTTCHSAATRTHAHTRPHTHTCTQALDQAIAQLNLNKTHAEKLGKIMGADAEESVNKRIGDLRHRLGNKCKYKMMIKNGDDVRQDQLVVQLIKVMDRVR